MDNNNNIPSGLTEEERARLEKIEKLDSNQGRKKVIFACITIALVAIFVLGTVFGGKYILSYEGTEALPAPEKIYDEIPEGNEKISTSFLSLEDSVQNFNSIKLDKSVGVSIPEEFIGVTDNDTQSIKYLKYVRKDIESAIYEIRNESSYSGTYGDDFRKYLPKFNFTEKDIETSECNVNEENESELNYSIVLKGAQDNWISALPYASDIGFDESHDIIENVFKKYDSVFSVNSYSISIVNPTITASYNRDTEKLNNIGTSFTADIVIDLDFINEFKDLGNCKVSMKADISERYNFSYVSFSFNQDIFYIEKGNSDELKYKLNTDQSAAEIQIKWTSSDESVLSIDGNFYKGHKVSSEPVKVTGTYEYCGETYTTECIYYVRTPLEDVKLSEKETEIKVGEKKSISTTFKPDDATIKNVYWFTTDESIVTVNENGEIEGIKAGTASVYLISQDGNYKRACTVTVKEG